MQFTVSTLYGGWQKGAWSDRRSSRSGKHDYGVYGYILSGTIFDAAYQTCTIGDWRTTVLLSSKATVKRKQEIRITPKITFISLLQSMDISGCSPMLPHGFQFRLHSSVFQSQPSESAIPYGACRRTRPQFSQVASGQRSHARLTKEETKDLRHRRPQSTP